MAVLHLIINRRPIVSPVCSVVRHFQWSVAVVLGAVLVNAGGGGNGAVCISTREKGSYLQGWIKGLFWSCHIYPGC